MMVKSRTRRPVSGPEGIASAIVAAAISVMRRPACAVGYPCRLTQHQLQRPRSARSPVRRHPPYRRSTCRSLCVGAGLEGRSCSLLPHTRLGGESVVQGKSVTVRDGLGGRLIIEKKTQKIRKIIG